MIGGGGLGGGPKIVHHMDRPAVISLYTVFYLTLLKLIKKYCHMYRIGRGGGVKFVQDWVDFLKVQLIKIKLTNI